MQLLRKGPAAEPFHVMIKPQGPVCNLDCTYCYYVGKTEDLPHETGFRMPDGVLEKLIEQYIAGQPIGTPEVNFAWQGGEPTLLGHAFFERVVDLQAKYARPGMRILNSIQTNGMLLDDAFCEVLAKNDFLVGISIDGPEDLHDHFRKDRAGKGSFREVMRGLELLKKHHVPFNTLTTVHRGNARQGRKVYEFLDGVGSEYMQFIPVVERELVTPQTLDHPSALPFAGWSPRSVVPKEYGQFLLAVMERWLATGVGRVFVTTFEMMIGLCSGLPASQCVHSRTCGRNIALEHNGDAYRCDHYVFPTHRMGNIRDATLATLLDEERQRAFGDSKSGPLPGACESCEFLELCYGGCPAHRAEPNQPSHLCDGYKHFFRESLPTFEVMAEEIRREGRVRPGPRKLVKPKKAPARR